MKQLTKLFGLTVACSALFVLGCSGEDGVAGPKGEPGQPGANGKNCTTYSNDDADYLVCGKDTVEVPAVHDGQRGANCSSKWDDKKSAYVVTCGKESGKIVIEDAFLDKRDGNIYPTAKVGRFTWMAADLRFDTLDGTGSKCHEQDTACAKGRLYDWTTAMRLDSATYSQVFAKDSNVLDTVTLKGAIDSTVANVTVLHRGICPEGWHVPTKVEAEDLLDHVSKYVVPTYRTDYNNSYAVTRAMGARDEGGEDLFGLSLHYSGFCSATGSCEEYGEEVYLRLVDESSATAVSVIDYSYYNVSINSEPKNQYYEAVRCVMNYDRNPLY